MASPHFRITQENMGRTMIQVGSTIAKGLKGGPVMVTLSRERRTNSQNDKLWPMIRDISKQLTIGGNSLTEYMWKHVITAAFRQQDFCQGLNSSVVIIPLQTSRMDKKSFSELVEFIYSFGADPQSYGADTQDGGPIRWSEPAMTFYEEVCK